MAALQKERNRGHPISSQRYDYNPRRQSRLRRQRVEGLSSSRLSPPDQPLFFELPAQSSIQDGSSLPPSAATEVSGAIQMERIPSGDSIRSNTPFEQHTKYTLVSDDEAARKVKSHFNRVSSNSKHARYLKALIEQGASYEVEDLDHSALESIFTAMDSVFFGGSLKCRVQWRWSCEDRYHTDLIGTTALRLRSDGYGFETLIILSEPILINPRYDRRLLLSAFIHELIHCYLFIMCGFDARRDGGHTKGFHDIAGIVDKWASPGGLNLCNMKANLSHFRRDQTLSPYHSLPAEETQIVDATYAGWQTPDSHTLHRSESYAQNSLYDRGYPESIPTGF